MGLFDGRDAVATGGIHALVNSAGNVKDRSFLKMSDDDFTSVPRVQGTSMCSQEAAFWMRDQGSGGADRVVILEQPRYGTGIFKPGGWSVKDLQKHTKSFFGTPLEPFGLMKPPYPLFKDGVKPQPERSEAKGE